MTLRPRALTTVSIPQEGVNACPKSARKEKHTFVGFSDVPIVLDISHEEFNAQLLESIYFRGLLLGSGRRREDDNAIEGSLRSHNSVSNVFSNHTGCSKYQDILRHDELKIEPNRTRRANVTQECEAFKLARALDDRSPSLE